MDIFEDILIPVVTGVISSALVVFLGVRSLKEYIDRREREREIGGLAEFWKTGEPKRTFYIVCGTEEPSHPSEVEPRLGYAEAFGIRAVPDILYKI
jgi:hypothetical protein